MTASRFSKIQALRQLHSNPISRPQALICQSCRLFSSTPVASAQHKRTLRRRMMEAWLNGEGRKYKDPTPGIPNYLGVTDDVRAQHRKTMKEQSRPKKQQGQVTEEGPESTPKPGQAPPIIARPFPMNPFFRSEPVLSEEMKDMIYQRVVDRRQSIREVSIDLNVTMERVAAVVRLLSIERQWTSQGIPLNKGYQKTVLDMLPQTQWDSETNRPVRNHENINDLPVHSATTSQIFYPAPESKDFTRADAGRAFSPELLPADERIPHPEMIDMEKDKNSGFNASERRTRLRERIQDMEARKLEDERQALEREKRQTTLVEGVRWDFKFRDVNAETVGKHGRGRRGVGWRYGAPHLDRKRGQVKIPTKVE